MVESGLDSFGVFQRLSPRQKRCAALLVSGYSTNIAIAKRLGITSGAVANNISLIMDACGVFSRLNLVLFILRTPGLEQKLLEFEAWASIRSCSGLFGFPFAEDPHPRRKTPSCQINATGI
jgi:DNA-binding CsgD family transcriptional regulator